MIEKENASLKSYLFERRFLFLLILILVVLVGAPFMEDYGNFHMVFDIIITAIFVAAIYAISHKILHLILALILAVPMIGSLWTHYLVQHPAIFAVGKFSAILFFGFATLNILQFIFKQKEVTKEVIFAAVVVYLLMAFMWSYGYALLELYEPGSFSVPEGQLKDDRFLWIYYSFVTITTLGYGDMTPLTDRASGMAVFEAITGQIYLVVLVAWLVGMHVSRQSK